MDILLVNQKYHINNKGSNLILTYLKCKFVAFYHLSIKIRFL